MFKHNAAEWFIVVYAVNLTVCKLQTQQKQEERKTSDEGHMNVKTLIKRCSPSTSSSMSYLHRSQVRIQHTDAPSKRNTDDRRPYAGRILIHMILAKQVDLTVCSSQKNIGEPMNANGNLLHRTLMNVRGGPSLQCHDRLARLEYLFTTWKTLVWFAMTLNYQFKDCTSPDRR